jgi:hypothetical protein
VCSLFALAPNCLACGCCLGGDVVVGGGMGRDLKKIVSGGELTDFC